MMCAHLESEVIFQISILFQLTEHATFYLIKCVIGREPPTTWLVTLRVNAILKGTTRTKRADFSNW